MAREETFQGSSADPSAVRVVSTRSGLRVGLPRGGDFEAVLAEVSRALAAAGGARGAAVTVDAGGRTLGVSHLREIETLFLERHGAALLQVVEGQGGGARRSRGGPDGAEPAPPGSGATRGVRGRPARRRGGKPPRGAGPAEGASAGSGTGPAEAEAEQEPPAVPVLTRSAGAPPAAYAGDGLPVDITPTLLVRRTLRSGQRVRFNGNVVVLGDVNPGAEIVASGDIVVMGTLRGVAHAGATGGLDAIVAAFRLQPVQLRVATVIGRAPDGHAARPDVPEIARVRDGSLVVERFLPQAPE